MHSLVRNILAVVIAAILGSIVNMFFITISATVIPPPAGAIVTTTEGLQASMHLFEAKHFVFPFLAHAFGTLVGAYLAARIAATHKVLFAYSIALLFLCGGIASAIMLPAPIWFIVLDLVAAYLPMAWIVSRWTLNLKK